MNNLKNRLVEGDPAGPLKARSRRAALSDRLEPILVKAGRGKNTPQGSQFTFLPVEEGDRMR